MPKHTCHCPNCDKTVAPKFFGCGPCWFALPENMRNAVWASYRPGQEISKTPSTEYLMAARAAIEYLRENHKH
jgi:hypothetical protein